MFIKQHLLIDQISKTSYLDSNLIQANTKNSYWYLRENIVVSETGNNQIINSEKMCVELYGYTPETRTSTYDRLSDLPYINGCSTKQLINPQHPSLIASQLFQNIK